jgi:uncharacterized protein (DUF169 family)
MSSAAIAAQLESGLRLSRPPVAVAWVDAPPDGVATLDREVPSTCALWTHAELGVFHAPAAAHSNCPVGAMTMGFELAEDTQDNLMTIVQKMIGDGYLGADEPPAIPKVASPAQGVVYGPLAEFPLDPDVVLMWLSPAATMLFSEASGGAAWTGDARAGALGRPTCAALPQAINSGLPTTSLGCAGMRTFTGVSDELLLAVVPGADLPGLAGALQDTLSANAAMQEFYDAHRAQFAGAVDRGS